MSQINVNNIVGKNGASAVTFPHGINVTGVVTATTLNQNVTGNVTAGSFTGPLTGAVTGNVTGNCSGTAGSLAAGATGADLTLSGNLTVNGTTTTIDTATLNIEDRNIGIASVSNPSDTTADGAGLTIFAGADGNKILQWVNIGDGKWQFVGGTVEASNFVKSDGTPVAGDSDITSCLFV